MTTFNNIKELEQWIKTTHGQNSALDETKIRQVLTEAGQDLQKYMVEELDAYFQSYDPVYPEYRRGQTVASIQIGKPKKLTINEWVLEIFFDPSIANHPSVFGQEDGYTPWLLNSGWKTKLDATLNRDHFTRFKGTNFVTKAVNRFNESNPYGLKVTVEHNGEDVTGRFYSYGR
jgi:hypothetical protein